MEENIADLHKFGNERAVKQKAKETILKHLSLVDEDFPTAIEAKKTETTTYLY